MSLSPKHLVNIPLRSTEVMDERPNLSFNLNFNHESNRLRSFENWPVPFLDSCQMVSAGFYYLNLNNDAVRCAFCGIEFGSWVKGDDPMKEHQMRSPNCKFVKKLPCGNVPFIDSSNKAPAATEAGSSSSGIGKTECNKMDINQNFNALAVTSEATTTMEAYLESVSDFCKSKLTALRNNINQKSVKDIEETKQHFLDFFSDMQVYFNKEEKTFFNHRLQISDVNPSALVIKKQAEGVYVSESAVSVLSSLSLKTQENLTGTGNDLVNLPENKNLDTSTVSIKSLSQSSTKKINCDRMKQEFLKSSPSVALSPCLSDPNENLDTSTVSTKSLCRSSTERINSNRAKQDLLKSSPTDALSPCSSDANRNLDTSDISTDSLCQSFTDKINTDRAKQDLLESSPSLDAISSHSTDDSSFMSENLDGSDASGERKRLKKKKVKHGSVLSQKEFSSSEDEIKGLLNLKALRKRRKFLETSDSSAGNVSASSCKKKKKKLTDSDEISSAVSQSSPPSDFSGDVSSILETKDDSSNIYREMLLDSHSYSSDSQCSSSPKSSKKERKTRTEEQKCSKDGAKKKKRKYNPLLHGRFSISHSESEAESTNRRLSDENRFYDKKYEKLLEKQKKKKELEKSDKNRSSEQQEPDAFINLCEDDSTDSDSNTTNTPSHHSCLSSSDVEEVELLSQAKTPGRRNIRNIIPLEEMTVESRRVAKEEEERQKRLLDKEKILSEAFTAPTKLILDFNKDTKHELVTVHPALMEILKEHQVKGVKFMWNTCFETVSQVKSTEGSGCVLAHCMGLGKSLQVVALVHTIINHPDLNLRTVLILCPKSVVLNWGYEFEKWLQCVQKVDNSSKKVEIFDLNSLTNIPLKERRLRDWQNKGGVMLMSYNMFGSLVSQSHLNIAKYLVDPGPDIVVFDEGHLLKNSQSNISQSANQLRTKRRIVLTGTPMQNNLMEYYCMVNLVKPNYLGDKKEFSNRFFNPINNGQFQDSTHEDVVLMKARAHVLCKKLEGIVQRYDSNILESHLPERFEYVLKLRMSELQIKLYIEYLDSFKKDSEDTLDNPKLRNQLQLMECDKMLELIGSHPKLLSEAAEEHSKSAGKEEFNAKVALKKHLEGVNLTDINLSSKTALFFEILNKCGENGEKLLVFSQSLKTLDLLEFFLQNSSVNNTKETWTFGKDYFRLDGSTVEKLRQSYCQTFNSDSNKRARLFLLSTKAGGLGLNLTGANRAILFDVSWNPSVDGQSVYRIYRFGQSKPCYIYRFVMKGTMEEKKYLRQISKLSTSSRVIDKRQVGRHFQEKHLREIFEYNFSYDLKRHSISKQPKDNVLEFLLGCDHIVAYEEHDILLMNLQDEELTEEDRQKACDDYEKEKNASYLPTPKTNPLAQKPLNFSTLQISSKMNPEEQLETTLGINAAGKFRNPVAPLPRVPASLLPLNEANKMPISVRLSTNQNVAPSVAPNSASGLAPNANINFL